MIHSIKLYLKDGAPHTFRLGYGPCGREVSKLGFFEEGASYIIEQTCTDNDKPDDFHYPMANVSRVAVYTTDTPYKEN